MLTTFEADNLLRAWAHALLAEYQREVGYRSRSAVVGEYSAPDWSPPAPGPIREGDIDRASWVMVVMSSRHRRLYRDMRDHFLDGMRLKYGRLDEGRRMFSSIWAEWQDVDGPINSL